MMMEKINIRRHNNTATQAAMHGIKMPPMAYSKAPEVKISAEEKSAMDRALRQKQKEIAARKH